MRVKYLKVRYEHLLKDCQSIDISGSVKGMKKRFWGENALVVRCGKYYYNVSKYSNIYNNLAY